MTLLQLDVERFRCIDRARLEFDSRINLIVGQNASGKTSLLEAISLLGTGQSFRSPQTEALISRGTDDFLLVGRLQMGPVADIVGIKGSKDGKEIRINGEPANTFADLASRLPVQIIDPEVHRLLEDGPNRRRRFVDWGVFHVEHQFHQAYRRYQRALRQRNAALKSKQPLNVLKIWDQELIEQGSLIALLREKYLGELKPFIGNLGRELLGLKVDIEYFKGWKKNLEFEAALKEAFTRDQIKGATSPGPHRADIILKVENFAAKEQVSRGQQKMLACAFILAQQQHRIATGASPACLLIDDPAAELDVDNLGKLLGAIAQIPAQLIVTSLDTDLKNIFPTARLFHVEHGEVRAVA
ncbi:MAG: DNA replication/repair protein RecF [Steroidobacteraceae bacterium]